MDWKPPGQFVAAHVRNLGTEPVSIPAHNADTIEDFGRRLTHRLISSGDSQLPKTDASV